jgi:hypothetical protein
MTDTSYYGSSQQDIIQQIVDQSGGDVNLEEALLWGAQGESGTGSNMGSPSAGGIFGFTPPSAFGLSYEQAQQAGPAVAAILPSYQQAETGVPSDLQGLARAEYIAIGGEKPAFDTAEQAQIAATGQPLTADPYMWGGGDYGGSYVSANAFTYGENTDPSIGQVVQQELGGFIPSGGGTGAGPGGSKTPQLTSLTTAQKGTKATTGLDPLTSILVALDTAMNPPIVKAGLLGTIENLLLPTKWEGDVRDFIEMNLSRLGFAAGFLVLGIAGTIRIISGGRVSGKDLPGLVAGFIGGPEAGALNALRKFTGAGIAAPRRVDEAAEGRRERAEARAEERLSFARSREDRAAEYAPGREERAQEAALRAVSREGRAQRAEIRQEGAAELSQRRESRLGEGLQLRRESLEQRTGTESARLEQAGARLRESTQARRDRNRQQNATRFLRANQFSQREGRLGRSLNLREEFEPQRVAQSQRRVELSAERNDLRRWGLEMQAARQNFLEGLADFTSVMERE